MNIEHLRLFVRVSITNNISLAGRQLGLSSAVASSHISKLEEDLGVRVIHRSTRHASLTEDGKVLLSYAERILNSVNLATDSVKGDTGQLTGVLRVAAPTSFCRLQLISVIQKFMQLHPDLTVEFSLSDTLIDLSKGRFDVVIRSSENTEQFMVAQKLSPDSRFLCASPKYLEKFGQPKTPEELKHHNCLSFSIGNSQSVFQTNAGEIALRINSKVRCDDLVAIRDLTASGLGIGITTRWCSNRELDNGELVPVLSEYPFVTKPSLWVMLPRSKTLSPKVTLFIKFLKSELFEGPK